MTAPISQLYKRTTFDGTPDQWNDIICRLPHAHILQTSEWAQVKETYGWMPIRYIWEDREGTPGAAAQILQRTIDLRGFSAKLRILYIPRGPLMDWSNTALHQQVLNDLESIAKKRGAIFIKIDPEAPLGEGIPGTDSEQDHPVGRNLQNTLQEAGWQFSKEQIQFKNTAILALHQPAEELLAAMKQKTRYNVRLASRKGVIVREGALEDLPALYKIYAETSLRDGFVIRNEQYYQTVWTRFMQNQKATPLIAEVEGEMVAGLFLFHFAETAWYLYGMSSQSHREKMPNYLLQWEAIQKAKELGCLRYDLWGAPDVFDKSDSMWGVFRFKLGLGASTLRTMGAWDHAPRPWLYTLYTRLLPRLLELMRRRGRKQTSRDIQIM